MNIFVRFIFRLLPDEFVEDLNDVIMDELDERGLIIWQDDIDSGTVVWAEDLERINKELLN